MGGMIPRCVCAGELTQNAQHEEWRNLGPDHDFSAGIRRTIVRTGRVEEGVDRLCVDQGWSPSSSGAHEAPGMHGDGKKEMLRHESTPDWGQRRVGRLKR